MRRLIIALVAGVTVAAGLAVHLIAPGGAINDAVGDVLYAVLIALLVLFIAPRARWRVTGAIALGWCFGVEFLQLTSLPAQWAASVPPLRLVLGSGFSAWDLLWYAVGVAFAVGVDAPLAHRRRMTRVSLSGSLICADPAQAALVERLLPAHVARTREEPGCLTFEVRRTEDPLVWRVSELFEDHVAFDAHQARVADSEWGRETVGIRRDYVVTSD
ncbi:DUF2809 domain-containing protein [Microbacterium sp.]|uniref:DUF2809 domain-containing protein n=1 Tax=Microbacterium sp. TaxID=51671 RepID=UPI003C72A7FF